MEGDYRHEIAQNGFEAGIQAETFHPDTIVIDLVLGRNEALQMAKHLRRTPAYKGAQIIGLANEDEADLDGLRQYGFTEVFKKPFDDALLAEQIRTYAEEKRTDEL